MKQFIDILTPHPVGHSTTGSDPVLHRSHQPPGPRNACRAFGPWALRVPPRAAGQALPAAASPALSSSEQGPRITLPQKPACVLLTSSTGTAVAQGSPGQRLEGAGGRGRRAGRGHTSAKRQAPSGSPHLMLLLFLLPLWGPPAPGDLLSGGADDHGPAPSPISSSPISPSLVLGSHPHELNQAPHFSECVSSRAGSF